MLRQFFKWLFGCSPSNGDKRNKSKIAGSSIGIVVGVVGSDKVITGGQSNTITVRFTNTSSSESIVAPAGSIFQLAFAAGLGNANPTQNPYPWAIDSSNQIKNFGVSMQDSGGTALNGSKSQFSSESDLANGPGVPIGFTLDQQYEIQALDFFDMILDVQSYFPDGPTLVTANVTGMYFKSNGSIPDISYPILPNGFSLLKRSSSSGQGT